MSSPTIGDPHILDPGHAPTPFTAAAIRSGCPAGRTIRLSVERSGQPTYVRVNRFVSTDAEGAVQQSQNFTIEGAELTSPETSRATWLDLQRHASFPRDRTRIDEETIALPVGGLECLRYTVTDEEMVQIFWFALEKPGMPVKFISREHDVVTSSVTMISDVIEGKTVGGS
ncbi:MAG: hypothetical protein WB245_11685 [Acidimicrobiia bacterium]